MKRSSLYPEIHIRFHVKRRVYLYTVLLKINEPINLFVDSTNVTFKDGPSNRRVLCLQTDGNFTGATKIRKELKSYILPSWWIFQIFY